MAEPEEEEDPFAGMSATSSTVRRKSEPPEADPFADFAGPRSTRKRRALDRDDSATIQEMPGFVVGDEEPASEGFNPGVSTLAHRKDDSLLRLELAARMPDPAEPAPAPRAKALHPTLPLSPAQLEAAHASSAPPKKSGPRLAAAAPAELPGPTMPESLSAFGKLEDRPADTAKRRRAFGQDKALPARTEQLMEAIRPDETPGSTPVSAPKLAPRVVEPGKRAEKERAGLPGIAWLVIGLGAGVAATLALVWLLS